MSVTVLPLTSWMMVVKDPIFAPNGGIFHCVTYGDPSTETPRFTDYQNTTLTTYTDYTTKYVSAPLDFDAPDIEKHLRDIQVEQYSNANSVTITIEGQTLSDIQANTWTTIQSWTSSTLPFVGHIEPHAPILRVRVTIQGDGSIVIQSIYISWKPARWRS